MNILLPMGGLGSRFSTSHPGQLKPLINVCGKSMITRVISNLNQSKNIKFIIVMLKKDFLHKEFQEIFDNLNIQYELILIDKPTEGPACTCLLAKKYINNDEPLVIVNCDQIIFDLNLKHLIQFLKLNEADGVIGVFHSNSNKNSYIKLGEDLRIQEVKEKIVISNIASNGLHLWSKGSYFVKSAEEMIQKNDRYSNEFYVAPTYNYLIKDGKKIIPYYFNLHYPIGTPEDLSYFEKIVYESCKD